MSLTRDLGLPVAVSLPPPLRNVGAIGGLTPGCDLALEALDDCSFPFPLERPLDLEGAAPRVDTPDRVGLGLIPHPAKFGRGLNSFEQNLKGILILL